MSFDAGSIIGQLEIDLSKYERGLVQAARSAEAFDPRLAASADVEREMFDAALASMERDVLDFDRLEASVELNADTSGLQRSMVDATGASGTLDEALKTVAAGGLAAVGFGAVRAGGAVLAMAGDFFQGAFVAAAEAEQIGIAFEVMFGSAERAAQMQRELAEFANATPFRTDEVVAAGRSLAAYQTEADKIVPTLEAIGDVAAGTGVPIGELAEIFGKIRLEGRVGMEEINQLAGRGVPIYSALADVMSVTEQEIRELAGSGAIGADELTSAFQSMSGEGSAFFDLMERQSESLGGLLSTLGGAWDTLQRDLGAGLIDEFDLHEKVASLIDSVQQAAPDIVDVATDVAGLIDSMIPSVGQIVGLVRKGVNYAGELTDSLGITDPQERFGDPYGGLQRDRQQSINALPDSINTAANAQAAADLLAEYQRAADALIETPELTTALVHADVALGTDNAKGVVNQLKELDRLREAAEATRENLAALATVPDAEVRGLVAQADLDLLAEYAERVEHLRAQLLRVEESARGHSRKRIAGYTENAALAANELDMINAEMRAELAATGESWGKLAEDQRQAYLDRIDAAREAATAEAALDVGPTLAPAAESGVLDAQSRAYQAMLELQGKHDQARNEAARRAMAQRLGRAESDAEKLALVQQFAAEKALADIEAFETDRTARLRDFYADRLAAAVDGERAVVEAQFDTASTALRDEIERMRAEAFESLSADPLSIVGELGIPDDFAAGLAALGDDSFASNFESIALTAAGFVDTMNSAAQPLDGFATATSTAAEAVSQLSAGFTASVDHGLELRSVIQSMSRELADMTRQAREAYQQARSGAQAAAITDGPGQQLRDISVGGVSIEGPTALELASSIAEQLKPVVRETVREQLDQYEAAGFAAKLGGGL